MNYDIPSIAGRMVAVVLADFRESLMAGDAAGVRRVDRRGLDEAGEDAPHDLADGLREIPFAAGVVAAAGAGNGAEFSVARANGDGRRGGRRLPAVDRGASRAWAAIGRRRRSQ